jgi:hypothetical protein
MDRLSKVEDFLIIHLVGCRDSQEVAQGGGLETSFLIQMRALRA